MELGPAPEGRRVHRHVVELGPRQGGVAEVADLDSRRSLTRDLHLHGWTTSVDPSDPLSVYGSSYNFV